MVTPAVTQTRKWQPVIKKNAQERNSAKNVTWLVKKEPEAGWDRIHIATKGFVNI